MSFSFNGMKQNLFFWLFLVTIFVVLSHVFLNWRSLNDKKKMKKESHDNTVAQIDEQLSLVSRPVARVYRGGSSDYEPDLEIMKLKERRTQEMNKYNDEISEIKVNPYTKGEMIALVGLMITLLSLSIKDPGSIFNRQQKSPRAKK